MRVAFLAVALLLAGCASPAEPATEPDSTYSVPVMAAHAINGEDRTIDLVVSQGGVELGRSTFSSADQGKDDFQQAFTVTASAGSLQIEAFEGGASQAKHVIDPSKCSQPDFQVHVVDEAVHLWSSCD